jgi:hypothetical protein
MSIVEEIARPYGGLWPEPEGTVLGQFVAQTTRYLRRLQEANFAVAREPIEFALIRDGSFNAFATIHKGTDFVGLNLGSFFILNDLFLRIMAHPDVLPKVGKSASEIAPSVSDGVPPSVDFSRAPVFDVQRVIPNDPVRADYAAKLAFIARIYIVEHEFCHIFNGHVDWLINRHKFSAMNEVGASLIPGLSNLDLQTLEMDADCYGASHTLLSIFRSDPAKVLPNPFMDTYSGALFAVQFALYCVFRMFHNRPIDAKADLLAGGDHPPAILRQFIITATFMSRTNDNRSISDNVPQDQFNDITTRAMRGGEAAFLFLSGQPWDSKLAFDEGRFPEGVIEKCLAASGQLEANWQKLRNELQPFKRGAVLAE